MKFKEKIIKFNDILAEKATNHFQTMTCFYVFAIYGLLPLLKIFNPYMDKFLYWSNYVQLISLPLLAVGQLVASKASEKRTYKLNQASEKRNQDMYDMLQEEFQIIKDNQISEQEERQELQNLVQQGMEDRANMQEALSGIQTILTDMQELLNK